MRARLSEDFEGRWTYYGLYFDEKSDRDERWRIGEQIIAILMGWA